MPKRIVYRNGRPVSINVLPNITMPNTTTRRPTVPRPVVGGNAGYPVGFGTTDNTLGDATAPTGGRFSNAVNNYDYFGGMDTNTSSPSGQGFGGNWSPSPSNQGSDASWSPLGRAGSLGSLGGSLGGYFGRQEGGTYGGLGGTIAGTMLGNVISGGDLAMSGRQMGSTVAPYLWSNPYASTVGGIAGSLLSGEGINPGQIITGLGLRALGPIGAGVGLVGGLTGATRFASDKINDGIDYFAGTRFGPVARDRYAVGQLNDMAANNPNTYDNSEAAIMQAIQRQNDIDTYGFDTSSIAALPNIGFDTPDVSAGPFLPDYSVDTTVQPFSNSDVYSDSGPEWNGSNLGGDAFDYGNGGGDWGSEDPMWDLPNGGINNNLGMPPAR